MRRIIMLFAALFMFAGGCATTQIEDEYPDEEQIRENAKKSHGELGKDEKKHKK